VTLKMPAFEWVHVQLHQQKGMISLSPPTICNSAKFITTDYLQQCRQEPFATVSVVRSENVTARGRKISWVRWVW
ncbi:hypothetical protein, partial [Escherichia coli]